MLLSEFRCTCGGVVPVPHQSDPSQLTMRAICSDACGRMWEFTYDDTGAYTGQVPQLVDQMAY